MDNLGDSCNIVDRDGETAANYCSGGGAVGFKLLNRPGSVHQFIGGGKGTLLSITVPALYSRYEECVDKFCGNSSSKGKNRKLHDAIPLTSIAKFWNI